MGLLNLTESERLEILNLHNNAKIIKEQAAAPTAAAPTDDKSKIMAIQTALKTKYKSDLGTSGPNKDGIDGMLGPKTLMALSAAMKSKGASNATPPASGTSGTATPPASGTSGTATPPASTTTATTATAPATTATAPATTATAPATSTEVVGAEAPQQLTQASQQALSGQLTPQQIRQQSRFDQRLARQARRTERRAQQ
jgi:hypothetical protein